MKSTVFLLSLISLSAQAFAGGVAYKCEISLYDMKAGKNAFTLADQVKDVVVTLPEYRGSECNGDEGKIVKTAGEFTKLPQSYEVSVFQYCKENSNILSLHFSTRGRDQTKNRGQGFLEVGLYSPTSFSMNAPTYYTKGYHPYEMHVTCKVL